MAVELRLSSITNIRGGRKPRFCKLDFRGSIKRTKTQMCKGEVTFNEEFEWPVDGPGKEEDFLRIRLFKKLFGFKKEVGRVNVSLKELLEHDADCNLRLSENLVKSKDSVTDTIVTFEVIYHSSDSRTSDGQTIDLNSELQENSADERPDAANRHENAEIIDGVETKLTKKIGNAAEAVTSEHEAEAEAEAEADPSTTEPEVDEETASISSEFSPEDVEHIKKLVHIQKVSRMALVNPTIYRNETFKVSVTVIEARYLAGSNLNSYVEVQIGDKIQKSEPEYLTCNPVFNKLFGFEFSLPLQIGLDQILYIRIFAINDLLLNRWQTGRLVGEFHMDLRTVYEQAGHSLCNKWVALIDPSEDIYVAKGYVKCHIDCILRGESCKVAYDTTSKLGQETLEEIEQSMIMGLEPKRPLAALAVKIYRAEDLPSMSIDLLQNLRKSLFGLNKPPLEAYVEVDFAGHSGVTKINSGTHNPEWNEEILLTELFPPLSSRLRIRVMDKTLGPDDSVIATHFINLDEIIYSNDRGSTPTYGPFWVNLYGRTRKYTPNRWLLEDKLLNAGQGEGVAYRGRLLLSLRTYQTRESTQIGVSTKEVQPVEADCCGPKEDFVLFAALFEASAIDKELAQQQVPVYFEVSCGVFGNSIDGRPAESDGENGKSRKPHDWADWRSCTSPMLPKTDNGEHYYLNISNKIECLHFGVPWEDCRDRLYLRNILTGVADFLESSLHQIHGEFKQSLKKHDNAFKKMRALCKHFAKLVDHGMQAYRIIADAGKKASTDKFRGKSVHYYIDRLKRKCSEVQEAIAHSKTSELNAQELETLFDKSHGQLRSVAQLLKDVGEGVLSGPPDVFIWMLDSSHKRIAYARIKVHDVLHSDIEELRGANCAKVASVFLRKPGKEGTGRSGWRAQAQLRLYLWFGSSQNLADYSMGLPKGFVMAKANPASILPLSLEYETKCYFQFRAYIFLARKLLACDQSGLSNPYVRIVIREHTIISFFVHDTLNPVWDETMVAKCITFYSSSQFIASQPPTILVEIMHHDGTDPQFLGHTTVSPSVVTFEQSQGKHHYKAPALKWWAIGRNEKHAGELLASFELIEIKPKDADSIDASLAANDKVEWEFPKCYPKRMVDAIKKPSEQPASIKRPVDTRSISSSLKSDEEPELAALAKSSPEEIDQEVSIGHGLTLIQVPSCIRPKLAKYRVEIMFWGLRNLIKPMQLTNPMIRFLWFGQTVSSEQIARFDDYPNFPMPIAHLDIELPADKSFWPPLSIRCFEIRSYGCQYMLIGSHTIVNVARYLKRDSKEKHEKEIKNEKESEKHQKKNSSDKVEDAAANGTSQNKDDQAEAKQVGTSGFKKVLVKLRDGDESSEEEEASQDEDEASQNEEKAETNNNIVKLPAEDNSKQDDWWSKYYASIAMNDRELLQAELILRDEHATREQVEKAEQIHSELKVGELQEEIDDVSVFSKASAASILNMEPDDSDEDSTSVSNVYADTGKKQKWWSRMRLNNKKKEEEPSDLMLQLDGPQARLDAMQSASEEAVDSDMHTAQTNDELQETAKLDFFRIPLEKVKRYGGFNEWAKSFDLLIGKDAESDVEESRDARFVAAFKGNLLVYPISDEQFNQPVAETDPSSKAKSQESQLELARLMPPESQSVVVRVYVVRAINLNPQLLMGKVDSFISVQLGSHSSDSKDSVVKNTSNPIFGRCFEFEALFPRDSMLNISIYDHGMLGNHRLIGETRIDLENRLWSKHRATCGLQRKYETSGFNKWRDQETPSQILANLCEKHGFEPPKYELEKKRVVVNGHEFSADDNVANESDNTTKSNELALHALLHWQQVGPDCVPLVREHVETRPLYSPDRPGIEQGRLEMWVDLFPKGNQPSLSKAYSLPAQVVCSPRLPKKYELRCVIRSTKKLAFSDESFEGERWVDVMVKGWVQGAKIDMQTAKVRFR